MPGAAWYKQGRMTTDFTDNADEEIEVRAHP